MAIIGLGYVGLPLALRFANVGAKVFGIDKNPGRVRELQAGRSYLDYVSCSAVRVAIDLGFEAGTDLNATDIADVAIMCLPTPLTEQRGPDISFIVEAVSSLCQHVRTGQLLALESTTYPGTTEEVVRPLLERTGFSIGDETFLVYSPERVDPGNPTYGIANIPKLVSGSTPTCLTLGSALYGLVAERVVPVSSTRAAELVCNGRPATIQRGDLCTSVSYRSVPRAAWRDVGRGLQRGQDVADLSVRSRLSRNLLTVKTILRQAGTRPRAEDSASVVEMALRLAARAAQ